MPDSSVGQLGGPTTRRYQVRVIGTITVEAMTRDEAMEAGRRALTGETTTAPEIELRVTDAWTEQGGRRA